MHLFLAGQCWLRTTGVSPLDLFTACGKTELDNSGITRSQGALRTSAAPPPSEWPSSRVEGCTLGTLMRVGCSGTLSGTHAKSRSSAITQHGSSGGTGARQTAPHPRGGPLLDLNDCQSLFVHCTPSKAVHPTHCLPGALPEGRHHPRPPSKLPPQVPAPPRQQIQPCRVHTHVCTPGILFSGLALPSMWAVPDLLGASHEWGDRKPGKVGPALLCARTEAVTSQWAPRAPSPLH